MSGFPSRLALEDHSSLVYHHTPGSLPGILFCSGFNSNMQGDKALALESWCQDRGRQYTRFDYFGHGQSSGNFEDGTIGRWRDDTLAVLDAVTTGPQVIVGSSMGGWIMLLAALARPERIVGLVGVAAAPDFTRELAAHGLDQQQLRQLQESGYCQIANCYDDGAPYRISRHLLEEGDSHLLLGQEIALDVPVRLIQGQQDEDVPWERSLQLMERLASPDVELQLVKAGGHRLSAGPDLERLMHTVDRLLEQLESQAGAAS